MDFYSGATYIFKQIKKAIFKGSDEESFKIIDQLNKEIDEFRMEIELLMLALMSKPQTEKDNDVDTKEAGE